MGFSGSGKSTLAKKLGDYYNIPYLHLDNIKFYGDWQERTAEEQNQLVKKFLAEHESWVIDGNHTDVAPERFLQTDITILLIFNRFYCYYKCWKRYKENVGKDRESCPCEERFEADFKKWILYEGRTRAIKKELINELNKTKGEKHIFRNRRQLKKWLATRGIDY